MVRYRGSLFPVELEFTFFSGKSLPMEFPLVDGPSKQM